MNTEQNKPLTFREYYYSFTGTIEQIREQQREFRAEITTRCHISLECFYLWLRGGEPFYLAKKEIANYLQRPLEELFPVPTPSNNA